MKDKEYRFMIVIRGCGQNQPEALSDALDNALENHYEVIYVEEL